MERRVFEALGGDCELYAIGVDGAMHRAAAGSR